jgi:hypothetical protein
MDLTCLQMVLSFLEMAFGLASVLVGLFTERRKGPALRKSQVTPTECKPGRATHFVPGSP